MTDRHSISVRIEASVLGAVEILKQTGINLLGREFGATNNGSAFRDPAKPLVEFDPAEVRWWGRFREYGNSRTSITVELASSGRMLWIQLNEQDSANSKPLARLLRRMPKPSSPSNRSSVVHWYANRDNLTGAPHSPENAPEAQRGL